MHQVWNIHFFRNNFGVMAMVQNSKVIVAGDFNSCLATMWDKLPMRQGPSKEAQMLELVYKEQDTMEIWILPFFL